MSEPTVSSEIFGRRDVRHHQSRESLSFKR